MSRLAHLVLSGLLAVCLGACAHGDKTPSPKTGNVESVTPVKNIPEDIKSIESGLLSGKSKDTHIERSAIAPEQLKALDQFSSATANVTDCQVTGITDATRAAPMALAVVLGIQRAEISAIQCVAESPVIDVRGELLHECI